MQINLYDLLLKIQSRSSECVIYLIMGKNLEGDCPVIINGDKTRCENCIEEWLNRNVDF